MIERDATGHAVRLWPVTRKASRLKLHPVQKYSPPSPLDKRNMRIYDAFAAGASVRAIAAAEGVALDVVEGILRETNDKTIL